MYNKFSPVFFPNIFRWVECWKWIGLWWFNQSTSQLERAGVSSAREASDLELPPRFENQQILAAKQLVLFFLMFLWLMFDKNHWDWVFESPWQVLIIWYKKICLNLTCDLLPWPNIRLNPGFLECIVYMCKNKWINVFSTTAGSNCKVYRVQA